jgi:hypothetical protein
MKKLLLILTLPLLTCFNLFSQKAPVRFGDIDMEDMLMTIYPLDTTASAVILCDYGFFRAGNIQFTRNLRVKILKKNGYYWANAVFPTDPNTKLKGVTCNLVNGKIVQEKLKNESIFTERVTDQSYRLRIAMPNVKVGSIIDLEFSFFGMPREWNFQDMVPVRYSELNIEPSSRVRFKCTFYGLEHLAVSTPDRWIARNMPAFKDEPFMNSDENYITKLRIDILEIVGYHQFATTWDNISQDLLKLDKFGMAMDISGYLNDMTKSIKSTGATGVQEMKMAFDSIRQTMKWNETETFLTSSPTLGTVFRKKTGNSADINLMLYQLLKKLDIEVVPVVLSTRSNGILSPLSPSYSRINYVITQATVEGNKYLLDPSENYIPYYLLPFRCLNYNGRTVVKEGSQPVELSTARMNKKVTMYNLEMTEDHELKGDLSTVNTDYAALDLRKKYHSFNSVDEFLDDYKKEKVGLIINNSHIDNLDSIYKPVIENYKVEISSKVNSVGDELFILPMLYDQVIENPFKSEDRRFPVDYGYRIENTVITTLKMPSGYTISSLPPKVVLRMPDNSATFLFDAVDNGSEVKITGKLTISKSLISTDQYLNFREFYDQLVKKEAEPVILKKI